MRSRDYEEFIEFLNRLEARYLVVGAHAVAFHARPRATKDLDVFIEPTQENAELVLRAIRQFLGTNLGIKLPDLTTPGRIVQLGVAPTRIDLMSRLSGIPDFESVWQQRGQLLSLRRLGERMLSENRGAARGSIPVVAPLSL